MAASGQFHATAALSAQKGIHCLQKEAGWVLKQVTAFEEETSSAPIRTFNPVQVKTNFVKIQVMSYAEG